MRKTIKSALSVVLSAAIALTMGGVGMLTNNTTASAEDAKPSFTAGVFSYGTFAGWAGEASDTVEVKDYGEYTLTAEVTEGLDNLFASENGSAVALGKYADLESAGMGTAFEVVGKSIQINDGDVISWNVTPVNWDDEARLVIHNAWNADIDFKTDVVAPVKAGDKLKVTFEVKVKSADDSGDVSAPAETAAPATAPAAADLKGTAQLDSQANGWCGNEDCANVKATIDGAGTYEVSSTWEETQEDPQAYCAVTIADLKDVAAYVTFSDVTVWVDGKVVDIPVIYGGDKDCRIQLWNVWGNDGVGAGFEVPANLPETFYEIKVQFTIGVRETARDWEVEGMDSTLINIDTTKADYEPANKPAEIIPVPEEPTVDTNEVKSLAAAKKKVTVKKGKKVNVTVKVTATDNEKEITDKVTVTSANKKVAKVVKTSVKAGKIVVSVKAIKKGTAKITVKAAKKKAVITVKVK